MIGASDLGCKTENTHLIQWAALDHKHHTPLGKDAAGTLLKVKFWCMIISISLRFT